MKPTAIQQQPIEFTVKLAMTRNQWNDWLRHYGLRQMSCEIGLDSPQIHDLVAFQVVRQLREQGHTAPAPAQTKRISRQ